MSFDLYLQGFLDGDGADGGGDRMRAVLGDHLLVDDDGVGLLAHGDGTAEVHGLEGDADGVMVSRVTGADPWELLVRAARAAGWVILPVGGATCLTYASQRAHLPPELAEGDVVLVSSGAELLAVLREG